MDSTDTATPKDAEFERMVQQLNEVQQYLMKGGGIKKGGGGTKQQERKREAEQEAQEARAKEDKRNAVKESIAASFGSNGARRSRVCVQREDVNDPMRFEDMTEELQYLDVPDTRLDVEGRPASPVSTAFADAALARRRKQ
jgi:hypothetical protein